MIQYEKFVEKHIPTYYKWRNDETVAVFDQSEFLRPRSFEEIEEWSQILVNGHTYIASVDGVYIGTIALMKVDERNRHAELAIVIGEKDYWSKGYGSQMMHTLLEYGFEGLNLERLYLHVFSFNERAIKFYEKFNFKHEGTLRNMLYRNGKYHDLLAYGLMRDEWQRNL
ncbi:MAG: GNAT family N-acetyltransferase [Erysipelothrix sp.]|nr:GNAT family N-acetyltransferase [Erysipelothrix sp.]